LAAQCYRFTGHVGTAFLECARPSDRGPVRRPLCWWSHSLPVGRTTWAGPALERENSFNNTL